MPIWRPFDLATEIVACFAAVLGPGAAVRRPQNASRVRSVPREAEEEVQSSGLQFNTSKDAVAARERAAVDLLYSIAQAGSGGPCTEESQTLN